MLRALSGHEPPQTLVDVVYSETEGNPFFVEEVFQHLAEEGRLFDAMGQWRSDLSIDELEVPWHRFGIDNCHLLTDCFKQTGHP